jgi:elongation factor P--beta-lysine ligase
MTDRGESDGAAPQDSVCGWVVQDKGLRYLATDHGWLELVGDDGKPARLSGLRHGSSVRLRGRRLTRSAFVVTEVVSSGPPAARRPRFVVSPPDRVFLAAEARYAVDRYLHELGYPQVTLPTLWSLSREYGEEELRATHTGLGTDLYLLQSPEFTMYAAVAGGVERYYAWGRCYRYEESEPASRYLMEFEQIDIACAHLSLPEMLQLTEGVVRCVADVLGTPLAPDAFAVRAQAPDALETDGLMLLDLPATLPTRAREVFRRRLEQVGAEVEELGDGGQLAVRVIGDPHEVARIVDIAERIVGAQLPASHAPVWRSPLPVEPDPEDAGCSEYAEGSITSARVVVNGRTMAEEAELYLSGYEIAHAGIFADAAQFRRNIGAAGVRDGRFDWLLPMLDHAPPRMAKVGIGWERLLGALLGGVEPAGFQLFPRSGTGLPV